MKVFTLVLTLLCCLALAPAAAALGPEMDPGGLQLGSGIDLSGLQLGPVIDPHGLD
mgnify:FL=1